MTPLIIGKTGQVARELRRLQPDAVFLDRRAADLTDPERCAAAVRAGGADAVINAAAYTAVDRAEAEEATALVVNARAPGAMARAAVAAGIPFLHISTDYVFDGHGHGHRPARPRDPTAPLGAYGRTKLAGERAIVAAGGAHAILRTSWIFSAHGGNFVTTMLRLSESRDTLSVVADQQGGPTPARAVAAALLTMAEALRQDPARTGIYHLAGAPDVNWAGFARAIFARSGRAVTVADIPSTSYAAAAKRPQNSRLDCSDIDRVFGIGRPDWRHDLDAVLKELGAYHDQP